MKRITVAIPTIRGREKYLLECLRTCVRQPDDFEILVSDNPGGEAISIVNGFNDSRIRYIKPPTYLSMSAHWDFVMSQVAGDFVSFIGDDDGLMPGCIGRVVDIASQVGVMPIHHSLANYYWPDCIDPVNSNNTIFFHPTGRGECVTQSSDFLLSVAKAKARYVDGPMVYHNFIPTNLIRGLSADGVFFRRSAPDVYSSIAIAANTKTYFSTNELLTLSGQGARANGAAVQSGEDNGFLADAKMNYAPRFDSVTVQMALLDSLIEVAQHFGRPDLLRMIDYPSHFIQSFHEARGMRGVLRRKELRFALQRQQFPAIALGLFGFELKKIFHRFVQPSNVKFANIMYQNGDIISLPRGTSNIYDATEVLSSILMKV